MVDEEEVKQKLLNHFETLFEAQFLKGSHDLQNEISSLPKLS